MAHKEHQEHQQWIQQAIDIAVSNVHSRRGGPFGAIVVKDGKIIGVGKNEVTALNDPTAHAEVQAIRDACRNLGSFQLTDCVIYSSCEPCPMCIGAIYWARLRAVYFAATKHEAARAGFDDHFIYEQIELPMEQRSIGMKRITTGHDNAPFEAWTSAEDKIEY
jgi:guanine deaminase